MNKSSQGSKPSQINPQEELLKELKEQYARDLQLRDAQDSKADKMITISSAIASLIIALGTFLVTRIASDSIFYLVDIVILLLGVLLAAVAIAFFMNSFKLRTFYFPYGPDKYFTRVKACGKRPRVGKSKFPWVNRGKKIKADETAEGEKKEICENDLTVQNISEYVEFSKVKKDLTMNEQEFSIERTLVYIYALEINAIALGIKAKQIKRGYWCFLSSIVSLSAVLFVTLVGLYFGLSLVEPDWLASNELPIPNAGTDQVVEENDLVTLDGTESRDPDGAITSYLWNQTSGFEVDINNENDVLSAFRAPDVDNATEFKFKLSVKDNENETSEDTTRVIVRNDTQQDPSDPVICKGVVPKTNSGETSNPLIFVSNHTLEDKLKKSAQERLCPREVAFNEAIDGSGYVTAVDIPLPDA